MLVLCHKHLAMHQAAQVLSSFVQKAQFCLSWALGGPLRHKAACIEELWCLVQEEEEGTAPMPTLAERAFPARANPMVVAASSAATADITPPSVLMRHPDRGTGASVELQSPPAVFP